jgi:hypothetical protein
MKSFTSISTYKNDKKGQRPSADVNGDLAQPTMTSTSISTNGKRKQPPVGDVHVDVAQLTVTYTSATSTNNKKRRLQSPPANDLPSADDSQVTSTVSRLSNETMDPEKEARNDTASYEDIIRREVQLVLGSSEVRALIAERARRIVNRRFWVMMYALDDINGDGLGAFLDGPWC